MAVKKDKILKICQNCGKEYYSFPYRAVTSKFCSKECYNTTGVTRKCKCCNKDFYIAKNRAETANYCSMSCASKDRFKDGAWNKGIPNPKAIEYLKLTWIANIGNKYRLAKNPWNKDTIGICKPNIGTLQKGHRLNIGRKMSAEHIEKIASKKRGVKTGKRSEEVRRKMSERQRGEKSYLWRGGLTEKNKAIRASIDAKLWREAVFSRDNWTCQYCGVRGGTLHSHHIKSFAKYEELRFDVSNGVTLCKECHKKTDSYARNLKKQTA